MLDWVRRAIGPENGAGNESRGKANRDAFDERTAPGERKESGGRSHSEEESGANLSKQQRASSTSSKIDRLPEITKQDVYALDWSYMFDIQVRARAVKAGLIARLEISGEGNFVLYKQSADTRGRSALIEITQRSTFPSDDYIYHEVKPHWGGGEYVVRHNYLPKQNLYEYNVPGPPLINGRPMASDLPGAPPEARANTPEGQNEALKQSILQNFFEQMNPDDRHAIGRELASKNLGIKLEEPQEPEKPPTQEEVMIEEYFDEHPEEKAAYVKKMLLKPKLPSNDDDGARPPSLMDKLAEFRQMQEMVESITGGNMLAGTQKRPGRVTPKPAT